MKKAISLIYPKELIFTANDGNNYYIETGKGELSEAIRGDADLPERYLEDFELIEFANDNVNRWELDVE